MDRWYSGSVPSSILRYCRSKIWNCTRTLDWKRGAIADDIAYDNHDIDDGLRAGTFSVANLAAVDHVAADDQIRHKYPDADEAVLRLKRFAG